MDIIADLDQYVSYIDNEVALIKFSLPGCQPCKKLTPFLLELREKYPKCKMGEIDISKNNAGDTFDIHHVPVVHVYRNGTLQLIVESNFEKLREEFEQMFK